MYMRTIVMIAVIALAIFLALRAPGWFSPTNVEGLSVQGAPPMKGCVPPTAPSGNCGAPGRKGEIYLTKASDSSKGEVWSICPYECPGTATDDVSACRYDEQCATVDSATNRFNNGCIIKLNIDASSVDEKRMRRFTSRKEMEKALGYKICSGGKAGSYGGTSGPVDTSDMIIQPGDAAKHDTQVVPGGGAGPHGSQLPRSSNPGPGYPELSYSGPGHPDGHGGNPDPSCHAAGRTGPSPPGMRMLPHSPHAPFAQHGSFVAPHVHAGQEPGKGTKFHCECA